MIRCVTAKICQSGLGLSNGLSLEVKRMLEKKSGLNNVPHGKSHNLKILNFFLVSKQRSFVNVSHDIDLHDCISILLQH